MADDTFLERDERGAAPRESPGGGADATFIEDAAAQRFQGFQPLPPTLSDEGYRVVRELGTGAEARVWLCTNAAGEQSAVKLYHRTPKYTYALESPEYRRHFDPRWTVRIHRRGCDRVAGGLELHYEVMEYCPDGTLEEYMADRGPADDVATAVLERLAACLKVLQGEGRRVVHGDLKPRNVLVRNAARCELVLSDFGLTADLEERSKLSNLGQGTTAYNAPELMRYKGAPADWWSLGMVMYTVLVGYGYYQVNADTWLSQSAIEQDLLSRDVSLAQLDQLRMPDDRRSRWKLALAGLLTRDPELRWGAPQVESWLAGGSPPVHRAIDAAPHQPGQPGPVRAVEPFPFAGVGEFSSPRLLGEAMAAHPGNAARMLSGKGTERLVAWLRDDAGSDDDFSELAQHSWDPDAKVTYFIARLAPDVALTFRSHPITTPADLRQLVQNADRGVVDALFDAELLGSLATGARSGYRMIEANWRDLVGRAIDAARARGVPLPDAAQAQLRRHALLLAASDEAVADQYAAEIRRRVTSEAMSAANEVDWFARLRSDAGV